MGAARRGYSLGAAAYLLWGFFPVYFKLLRPATPLEILAHRVLWSAVFIAAILAALRRWRPLRDLSRQPRKLAGAALAAVLIAVNWGVYIYGVNSGHVVEASLGYFITPLVTVVLGVLVLRERLRAVRWVALAIGTLAVVVLTVDYGRPPWIALTLAVSFSTYGLTKKRLALPAAEGLLAETAALALPALACLAVLMADHHAAFGHASAIRTVLLLLAGPITAIPLLCFAGAANRIPLSSLGVLQYITPLLQFGLGVLIYHEPMPAPQLVGFALVWIALALFTADGLRSTGNDAPPTAKSGSSRLSAARR